MLLLLVSTYHVPPSSNHAHGWLLNWSCQPHNAPGALIALPVPVCLRCAPIPQVWYGLLSRLAGRDLRPASPALVERTREGTITIMPYD